MKISRILVPTDFSEASSAALEWARTLQEAFGAEALVLHVIDTVAVAPAVPPLGPVPAAGADPQAVTEILQQVRRQAEGEIARVSAAFRHARTLLVDGTPGPKIVEVAAHERADVIVMGTHGRSGLARVLFGSVAEHVVRHSDVPVLTVRHRAAR
ncbi:MAG: universal stress protein [Armatimonadota bacterium]|nr:universal stress protein [Armatimonadota bacterium]MDR5696707.1 universal stress protein [Armatimonadota bacterium]